MFYYSKFYLWKGIYVIFVCLKVNNHCSYFMGGIKKSGFWSTFFNSMWETNVTYYLAALLYIFYLLKGELGHLREWCQFSTCQHSGLRDPSHKTDFYFDFNLLYMVTLLDIWSQISIKFRLLSYAIITGLCGW